MGSKDIKNKYETEVLSGDDQKVCDLLASLKAVDCPGDFDFRLKARMANAKPADYTPSRLLPILRYAIPLGVVLFVAAIFSFNGIYKIDNQSVPDIAATAEPAPVIVELPRGVETLAPEQKSQPGIQLAAATNQSELPRPQRIVRPAMRETDLGGGSIDQTLRNRPTVINPPGIDPESRITSERPDRSVTPQEIPVRTILSAIGINAEFTNSGWQVRSVVPNSPAERAGIKQGDAMDAIDGRSLDRTTVFSGTVNVNKLTVTRDGKKLAIDLKN